MPPLRIFISSVQKELATERAALRDYLRGDALMRMARHTNRKLQTVFRARPPPSPSTLTLTFT
jgi:hypothetical protein